MRHLRIEWSVESGSVVVVRLRGDIDVEAAPLFTGIRVVAELERGLVVDLSAVTFVDDAGLRLLRALAAGSDIRFRDVPASIPHLEAVRPALCSPAPVAA